MYKYGFPALLEKKKRDVVTQSSLSCMAVVGWCRVLTHSQTVPVATVPTIAFSVTQVLFHSFELPGWPLQSLIFNIRWRSSLSFPLSPSSHAGISSPVFLLAVPRSVLKLLWQRAYSNCWTAPARSTENTSHPFHRSVTVMCHLDFPQSRHPWFL